MRLTEILPLEKWVKLEEEITRRSGLDANIFDTDGIRISEYKHWANRLCPAIKDTDKGQSFICAVAHMNVAALAEQSKQMIIEECDAGLLKMAVPIFVKNRFIGAVSACGQLLDGGEVDHFLINKMTEIEEDIIETISADIQTIPDRKVRELGEFIQEEIHSIIKNYETYVE